MEKNVKTVIFIFVAAAIGIMGLALYLSVASLGVSTLCFTLAIFFLMLANTFLLYSIVSKLDKMLSKN